MLSPQQPPENTIGICPADVEESAIEQNFPQVLPLQKTVTSWAFMQQGHTLYCCIASDESYNLQKTEFEYT